MSKVRLFITGMGGMLGRQLAQLAVTQDYLVAGTINKTFPDLINNLQNNKLVSIYKLNLTKSVQINKAILDFQPDIIVHLAGKVLGRNDSKITDPLIYKDNTLILKNVIKAAEKLNKSKFILVSGCLVYDKLTSSDSIQEIPIEKLPKINKLKEPYRASRIEQERMLIKEENLDYIIVRPTQITGPGKIDGVIEYFLAKEISQLLKGEKQEINVRNKLGEVDLIDVRDAANAIIELIKNGQTKEIYHLSSGFPVTVETLAKTFLRVAGFDPKQFKISSTGEEQKIYFRFSADKLKSLGWNKKYNLEQTLASYFEYFKMRHLL